MRADGKEEKREKTGGREGSRMVTSSKQGREEGTGRAKARGTEGTDGRVIWDVH